MQRKLLLTLVVVTALSGTCPVLAAEPVLEFVEGLRRRQYYDIAVQYLDQIEQDPSISDEIRQVIPYERAQTLLSSAKDLTNLDAQRKQLDAAQASFEDFVKASPGHELAGRANTARGRILLEKARVEIWDGDKPSNEGSRQKFRDAARGYITTAKRIFEQARDQHQKAWESYPTYIPEDQKVQRAARAEAEALFMEAQLDLAQCTYWLAQTYDKGTDKRKELLTDAAFEFEEIHTQYRSQIGGLYARMWQGKCFEEQDEIGIALGIYEELLGHEGLSTSMRNLKDRALRFRLICLNHEERRDYELVALEADEWLKEARARARTDVGLGIQWELCRAHEALGNDRTLSDLMRRNHLTQALNRARAINRYPGELKTPSSAMIQRLMVALNREPGDPKDFDTAYGNASQLFDELKAMNEAVRKAAAEGKTKEALKLQDALGASAAEMARLYALGLKFATDETDPRLVNIARLRLAYGYLLQGRYLDAAVVADFQMEKFGEKYPEVGREAGFLAMSAFDYAYSEASESDREFEARMVVNAAEKLAQRWPDTDRANDARNAVAKIHWQQGDLEQAAAWWEKIPQGTNQYVDAQIRAGKAYWRLYVLETAKPAEERASPEDLAKWKDLAIQRLTAGLNQAETQIPDEAPLPDELVGAKLTLVNIRNLDGVYTTKDDVVGALELLTAAPHPVIDAVSVPEGQQRPEDSSKAQSREMASFAFQQLLRTQIGLKNLEEARKARQMLENVASGEDEAALTQVFVEFGRELQQELERLKASGETERLNEVRTGFEAFLQDLFNRKEGQTFYSLLWIAETYASLGEGSEDDVTKSDAFFAKAAEAYQSILDTAASDPMFATPAQVLACKLRLVNSRRRQKAYEEAETVMLGVLEASPNAPDAQFEAARLYQDWASSGAVGTLPKFEIALYGNKEPVHVWGWSYMAQSLQRALYGKNNPALEKLHFDARYNLAKCERQYGLALDDIEESKNHLERARSSITGFQRLSKRWPDEEYERFNALYREILSDLGQPQIDLPRDLKDTTSEPAEQPGASPVEEREIAAVEAAPAVTEKPAPKSNAMLIVLMLVLGVGAVGGLYYFATQTGNKNKYAKYTSGGSAPTIGGGKAAPKAAGETRKRAARPSAEGAPKRKVARRSADPAAAQAAKGTKPTKAKPKGKPRPPSDAGGRKA